MDTLVSVIISNYNYAKYIGKAIDSVINQTYKNFELIIVDDGSKDDSPQIIKSYQNKYPWIKTVFHRGNQGMSSSFQDGFLQSKGEIICTLDSDDWYYPELLMRKVEMHQKHTNAVMVDTAVTTDGRNLLSSLKEKNNYHDLFINYGYAYSFTSTSGLSVRRDVFKKYIPFIGENEDYGGLDMILTYLSLAEGEVAVDRRIGVFRLMHEDGCREERKRTYHDSAFVEMRDARLKKFIFRQLEAHGFNIPQDDMSYYRHVLTGLTDGRKDRKYILYGLSPTSQKCTDVLEGMGISIYAYCDSRNKRFYEIDESSFHYPVINSTDLAKHENKYDFIIIASRQSDSIIHDLKELGIYGERILNLPL